MPIVATINEAHTVCTGSAPNTLSAVLQHGNTSNFDYQWQEAASAVGPFNSVAANGNAATYTPPAINVDTWYRVIVNNTGCDNLVTSDPIKVSVAELIGDILFSQTICSGKSPSPITATSTGGINNVAYEWQMADNSGGLFATVLPSTIGASSYQDAVVSAPTWCRAIISAVGCPAYTTNSLSVHVSTADATVSCGNDRTMYAFNELTMNGASVGGSASTAAWSI